MTSQFYEQYWSEKEGHLHDYFLKWPTLKRFIPKERNLLIVDFGCGNGEIGKEIVSINPNATYIGLDVSEEALRKARKGLPNTLFQKIEDGGAFPLQSHSADFVFSSEVLEHVYDTKNAFREIGRILKPGGGDVLSPSPIMDG